MSLRRTLAALAAVLSMALPVGGQAQSMSPEQRQALNAAERWLVTVDAERYANAWAMAAESFKASVPQKEFRDGIRRIRQDYGRVVLRKSEKIGFVGEAPKPDDPTGAAKEGMQIAILFDTKFAGSKRATEEMSVVLEKDGLWRVAGYHIR